MGTIPATARGWRRLVQKELLVLGRGQLAWRDGAGMLDECSDGREDPPNPRGVIARGGQHARPARVKHRAQDPVLMPRSTASSAPLAASHSRAVRSLEAVSTRAPLGSNTALRTQPSWPRSTASWA